MGQSTSYALDLCGMPTGTQQFTYTVGDDFFSAMESSEIRAGHVDVELTVKHEGDMFDLSFEMTGEIVIGCDRCLDDLRQAVDTEYAITVKYGEEYNDDSDDTLIIPEGERSLDLSGMIYDTIALTIPLKHVHEDGECNAEMLAQFKAHSGAADMEEGTNDPRWEALRNLLDNNK